MSEQNGKSRKHPFLGPSRADWMTWVADQVGMQDIGRSMMQAYLKSQYGDGITFEEPMREIAGGNITHESCECVPPPIARGGPRPKSGGLLIGIGLLLGAMLAISAFSLALWLLRPVPSAPVAPISPIVQPVAPAPAPQPGRWEIYTP